MFQDDLLMIIPGYVSDDSLDILFWQCLLENDEQRPRIQLLRNSLPA